MWKKKKETKEWLNELNKIDRSECERKKERKKERND